MCNLANHTIWCDCHTRPSLKEQLAQARREGWEQGKKEAAKVCHAHRSNYGVGGEYIADGIGKALAAMEYGGEG